MIFDLQKASILKRVSAFILDIILLVTLAVGAVYVISAITGYDGVQDELTARQKVYEDKYGISFDLTSEEYDNLTEEELSVYKAVETELQNDKEYMNIYSKVITLTLLGVSLGTLLSVIVLEFVIPLLLKNGQTVGKKVFGLGVMRCDGIKLQPILLFVRSILGKYVIEIMIPLILILMLFFGLLGFLGVIVLFGILIFELILMFTTNTNSMIHDVLSNTVVIDFTTQKIFDTLEQKQEYINKLEEEKSVASEGVR